MKGFQIPPVILLPNVVCMHPLLRGRRVKVYDVWVLKAIWYKKEILLSKKSIMGYTIRVLMFIYIIFDLKVYNAYVLKKVFC